MDSAPFPIAGECRCPDLVAATFHYPGCVVGALVDLEAQCDLSDSTSFPTPTEPPSDPVDSPPAISAARSSFSRYAKSGRRTSVAWRAG